MSSLDAASVTSICIASPSPVEVVGKAVASEVGELATAGEVGGWATGTAGGGTPDFVGSCNWFLVGLGGAQDCCSCCCETAGWRAAAVDIVLRTC